MRVLLPGISLLGMVLFVGHDGARAPTFAGEARDAAPAFATNHRPDASRGPYARPGTPPSEALNAVVRQYCFVCHNDAMMTGNMTVQSFDVTAAWEDWETAERMIAKLRTGMMPPPGIPRPGGDTLLTLVETLEQTIDDYAAANPNPGNRSFQRLNRAEYEQAVQDLFGITVDASQWLPPDLYLGNFDHMAVSQPLSPTLLNSYLNAANDVSRLVLGHPGATSDSKTYLVSTYQSQHEWDHVEGAPYGTRGGIVVDHHFPADGEYVFEMSFWAGDHERFAEMDISIDGERVALVPVEELRRDADFGPNWNQFTDPIFVSAGQRRVAAAFIRKQDGPYADLQEPFGWSNAGVRFRIGTGFVVLTHLRDLSIRGPLDPQGVSETPSRQRIFTCRPTSSEAERSCAREIAARLARQAYRRPLTDSDLAGLMSFYDVGAAEGGFETGVRTVLEAILASPHFVFRIEEAPENELDAGGSYLISDLALASRLSYFLWGTQPDDELVSLASGDRLSDPRVLEQQVRRMLADPRSESLATRFATQWLRLQDLERVQPDAFWFPHFNEQLKAAMRRETELFFDHLVREDRSLLELYGADYSFMNQRLAEHYGIRGVVGENFRRVDYPEGMLRQGLLGHGSVLMSTSMGTRTSPVLRGKWVMEVLLDAPPPPPPPDVPALEETEDEGEGRLLTTRERLEIHRRNPVCAACHQFMDPIGVALENFGVTGEWRIRESGSPLDARGQLYDGTDLTNSVQLADALLERPIPLVRTFTMNLLAYALGRRVEYYDGPTIRAIAREAESNDYRISSFVLGVVQSDAFRSRQDIGAAATDGVERGHDD
ncbi:MAG: DUF1592 domain-containing protein [Gammaproteobacteria bacterium]|nr:DUF1592 domain-containing protein [Gammaproteobacteria bacterium]